MCQSCNKNSCKGGCSKSSSGKDMAALLNKVAELQSRFDELDTAAKFLKCGHPMMMIQNNLDIATFSFSTGLGSKCWEGWAICNGNTYESPSTGEDIVTPNMLDRFPVGAGDTYSVDDVGGLAGVALAVPELPAHSHTLTDTGHTHDITDPGHNHGASSASHSHSLTTNPHTHVVDGGAHRHNINPAVASADYNGGSGPYGGSFGALSTGTNYAGLYTSTDGEHEHEVSEATVTGSIGGTAAAVTVSNSFVGITETENHETGITINDTGSGEEHENRPPYYAVLFIIKL